MGEAQGQGRELPGEGDTRVTLLVEMSSLLTWSFLFPIGVASEPQLKAFHLAAL